MLLCLVAAVVYSISLILQKPLVGRLPAVHVTWLACTIGAVVCLPFAGQLVERGRATRPASSIWWLVYLGVFPTAIAFTTYAFALKHMTASSLGVTTYLVPPITIVMGAGLPRRGAADDGVRRRRARPGRRRRGPAQAAHGRRLAVVPTETPARGCHAASSEHRRRTSWSAWSPPCTSYFLVLEMFLWTKPTGRRMFGTTAEFAEQTKALAANQGLYNGFLVAGLVWGLVERAVRT